MNYDVDNELGKLWVVIDKLNERIFDLENRLEEIEQNEIDNDKGTAGKR